MKTQMRARVKTSADQLVFKKERLVNLVKSSKANQKVTTTSTVVTITSNF